MAPSNRRRILILLFLFSLITSLSHSQSWASISTDPWRAVVSAPDTVEIRTYPPELSLPEHFHLIVNNYITEDSESTIFMAATDVTTKLGAGDYHYIQLEGATFSGVSGNLYLNGAPNLTTLAFVGLDGDLWQLTGGVVTSSRFAINQPIGSLSKIRFYERTANADGSYSETLRQFIEVFTHDCRKGVKKNSKCPKGPKPKR